MMCVKDKATKMHKRVRNNGRTREKENVKITLIVW
jgi:hypothetical protein